VSDARKYVNAVRAAKGKCPAICSQPSCLDADPACRSARAQRVSSSLAQADIVTYTAAWYAVAVSLTLFNKWFYSYWRGGFDLPISSTACHMVVKAIIARVLVSNRCSPYFEEPYPLTLREQLLVIAPIGLATAGDVVLSNMSFLYITV